jgi:RNA polymerase sigma factor (sigma-70 family)
LDLDADLEIPLGLVASSVESQFDERALMKNLLTAMNNDLSDLQWHVIILRFLEGFSLRETAQIVCKKVNHVKVIQNRGIARLRKSLQL